MMNTSTHTFRNLVKRPELGRVRVFRDGKLDFSHEAQKMACRGLKMANFAILYGMAAGLDLLDQAIQNSGK